MINSTAKLLKNLNVFEEVFTVDLMFFERKKNGAKN